MQSKERKASPFYDEIISRSKAQKTGNYIFKGHKLDIAKEMFGNSIFSLSNSEHGLNVNYTLNFIRRVFSLALYGNGSFLGKITPGAEAGGIFGTYMSIPGEPGYFDLGFMRANEYGSVSVKVLNPKMKKSLVSQTKKTFHSLITGTRSSLKKSSFSSIKSEVSQLFRGVRGSLEEGMLASSIVARVSSSLHFGAETLLSFQKARAQEEKKLPSYRTGMVHTFVVQKLFSTWTLLGLLQTTGRVGAFTEKVFDDSLIFTTEVLVDAKDILQRKKVSKEAVTGAIGLSVIGSTATTRVSIDTQGTLEVVADIQVGEGASLNISGQLSEGSETVLGVGFTMSA